MKKSIALILALALVLVFTGCGGESTYDKLSKYTVLSITGTESTDGNPPEPLLIDLSRENLEKFAEIIDGGTWKEAANPEHGLTNIMVLEAGEAGAPLTFNIYEDGVLVTLLGTDGTNQSWLAADLSFNPFVEYIGSLIPMG